jgi:hypothetical protein
VATVEFLVVQEIAPLEALILETVAVADMAVTAAQVVQV